VTYNYKPEELIEEIYIDGVQSQAGISAIKELSQFGKEGVDAIILSLEYPSQTSLSARDLMDSISETFWALARDNSVYLIDLMLEGRLSKTWCYPALGNATTERSIDVLINGLSEKESMLRWLCVEALIQRKPERAISPLVERLKDRSELVKSSIVTAMKHHKWLRTPDALPLLKSIREKCPGTWNCAGEVIDLITEENTKMK
tara:strand:- start:7642 stop:8250 length:609 start_codon:yes stop_codon:yes gene_type:complete